MAIMLTSSLLLCFLVPLTLAQVPALGLRQTVDINSSFGMRRPRIQALFLLILWTTSLVPQLMISVRESLIALIAPIILAVIVMTVRSRQEI